jgi:outer membrane protein
MSKSKILLSVGALILVIGLFFLPKAVVNNDESAAVENQEEATEPSTSPPGNSPIVESHNTAISPDAQQLVKSLRENINNSADNKNIVIFADSLAAVFKSYNMLDSAAKYQGIAAERSPALNTYRKAGDAYYDAFTFAVDKSKAQDLAEKARSNYNEAIKLGSGEEALDMKANIAMTFIATSNPMQGISLLTEILEEDPEHEGAIFNLGILSIQSNQYDKAVDRFEKLVTLHPENLQGQFYLGLSYMESGEKEKAREQFEKVKTLDSDPEVQATVDSYLEEIK